MNELPIQLHPEAERELKQAALHYQSISKELKISFIEQLNLTFQKIMEHPEIYPFVSKFSQKVVMKKFPYLIIYQHNTNKTIIMAIFHNKRNPQND